MQLALASTSARKYDHVRRLQDLHWLRVPERITYQLCVLDYCSLHSATPGYLPELVLPVANIDWRRRLQSASTGDIVIPATQRRTIDDRAFAVADPRVWNSLLPYVRSAQSVNSLRNI